MFLTSSCPQYTVGPVLALRGQAITEDSGVFGACILLWRLTGSNYHHEVSHVLGGEGHPVGAALPPRKACEGLRAACGRAVPGAGVATLPAASPSRASCQGLGALRATELEGRLQAAARRQVGRQTCGRGTFLSETLGGSEL